MTFVESGNLVTDEREINTSDDWGTQSDWEAFQESNDIAIENGVLRLATTIPDSGALHARYDFREYSGTSNYADLSDNSHDLVNGSITGVGESINGQQAGEFNKASDDGVWSDTFSDIYPLTAHIVLRLDGSTSSTIHDFLQFSDSNMLARWNNTDEWQLNAASNLNAGSAESDPTAMLLTVVFADSGALIRQDMTEIASGSTGTGRPAERVSIGSGQPNLSGTTFEGAIGEMRLFPEVRTTMQIETQETDLAQDWGLEIWTASSSNPLITERGDPDWIKVSGTYYLYCFAQGPASDTTVFTSADGVSFSNEQTVLQPSSSGWDSNYVVDPSIAEHNGTYYLYYSGHDGSNYAGIGVATASSPTGPFSKSSNNPILTEEGSGWESARISEPHVRIRNGTFYLTYSGEDGGANEAIGLATSTDGESFTKEASNPIYDPGNINDQCHVYANGMWHLYYTDKSTLNMEKVTSSDIASFSAPESEVIATSASDYSPAIRYDSDDSLYRMYWNYSDTNANIHLSTSPTIADLS